MSIIRSNKYLGEIIEILDMHRSKYRAGDIGDDEARASLSSADNEWIDGELYHSLIDTRYFLSNYYAIRTEDKGFQGLYPFFDSQEILYEELRKLEKEHGRVRALVAKARRMGYTTYMIGEFLHKTVIRYKHTDAIIVSQDEKGAKYNMGMYESAFDFLPWWMKPRVNLHQTGALYNFDEPDENLRTSRPGLKNWLYADNANRPSGVGRGQGFRCGMLDELAFWKNASQLSKSLLRTFVARDGFYVMGSTGNGRNDAWHNLWRRAEAGSIDWHPIFIPFYRRPKTYSLPIPKGEVFTLSPEEKEMIEQVKKKENFTISNETINWMRKTKEEFVATDGDDMLFSQEFPCLIGKTRVSTNGGMIMLSDLRNHDGRTTGGNEIKEWVSKGKKPVFRAITRLGYSVVGTFDHIIPTVDAGDVELGNLIGHYVELIPPEFGSEQQCIKWEEVFKTACTTQVDESAARFLGYFIGDGCYTERSVSIACDRKDQDVIEDVESLMNSLFGRCQKRIVGNEDGGIELRVGSVGFMDVMKRFGIWKRDKPHRKVSVPDAIFKSPKNIVREFLRALFEADGFCGYEGNRVSLFAKGKDFLRDVQVLLLGFGITSRLVTQNKVAYGNSYTGNCLELRSAESNKFCEEVGFIGERKRSRNFSPVKKIGRPKDPIKFQDKVVCIIPEGEQEVFDITVEKSHKFSANGILVHNCAAEDSFQNSIISAIPRGIINRFSKRTEEPRWVGEITFDFAQWVPHLYMKELKPGEEAIYPETENRLHIWERPQPGERYCLGVDTALGQKGGDYSSCTIIKLGSRTQLDEQVAQWHGYMDPHNLTDVVLALGWYYNEALVAIEVNSFGLATNTRLMREYEYENIYRFKRMDRLKHFMTDIVGWWTDYKSKRTLISFMSKMMLDDQVLIRDKNLIDELRDFTEDGAEGEGAHDDYCFVPDTLIRTNKGMVKISSVKVGDAVLSHDGLWRMVDNVGYREVKEDICIIRPFGSDRPIRCTEEHPIFLKKRRGSSPVRLEEESWVAARGVEKGDVVYYPVAPNLQPPPLSDDELYLLGWCLADGYASNQVAIKFGKDEKVCAEYIQNVIQNIVDRHPTTWSAGVGRKGIRTKMSVVSLKDEGNFFSIVVGNKWLTSWISYWIGNPGEKKIHEKILKGDGTIPFVVGFLEGDGSQKGTRRGAITVTQKNRQSLLDIEDMLRRHGVWCGIGPKNNKDGNPVLGIGAPWVNKMLEIFPGLLYERTPKGLDHPIARWDGRGFWVTVATAERQFYDGKVYNLAVDNSHSYTAEGFAVHNCMSFMIALYCGHEGEFEERRQRPATAAKDINNYIVYAKGAEGIPVKLYESSSPFEAEKFSKRRIGSWIVNEHGAMADLKFKTKDGDKTVRVPADFQNTAFSPVHDRAGTRHQMFDEGIPAEMIDAESAAEYDARQEEEQSNDNEAWKYI